MKVLFAGPSLFGSSAPLDGLVLRGPAAQGDLVAATFQGATAIGLVDGRFEDVAAVWHKEILFALVEGVQVFGAASMGALRAAECEPFGMKGVGDIFDRYVRGELDDDAAVAQIHAPKELGYAPLSEALVNVEATVADLREKGVISIEEASKILEAAGGLFFKDRTYQRILSGTGLSAHRRLELDFLLSRKRVELKRSDAELLVRMLLATEPCRTRSPTTWSFARTGMFAQTLERTDTAEAGLSR